MRYSIIGFILWISFSGYAQEISMLKGKIIVDSFSSEAIHILNQTQSIGVISNKQGLFEIRANAGDTIVFSSVQYALKQYVVRQQDIESDGFEITLEFAVNELDEVYLSRHSLTGNLKSDVLNIPTHTENLPFWSAAELEKMGVAAPNDAQSSVKNNLVPDEMSATPVDFIALGKKVGKLFKNKRKAKVTTTIKIANLYSEEFFIEGLKIPQQEYYNFLDYLEEQPGIQVALRSSDQLKILEYIIEKSVAYREKYGLN